MSGNGNDEGTRARIRSRVLEATSEDDLKRIRQELRDEGEKEGSISAVISELRKQGYLKFNARTTAVAKALPVEAIVETLPWPMDVDGHVDPVFVAGMKYEAINVIRGIRLAQELSRMDVERVGPLVKMAEQLRQGEVKAAETVGRALAQVTLESNEKILGALNNLGAATRAASPNPVQRMIGMIESIPKMFQAMNSLMGMLGAKPVVQGQPQGQVATGQQPQAQPPAQPEQPSTPPPQPGQQPGVEEVSAAEMEEVFSE